MGPPDKQWDGNDAGPHAGRAVSAARQEEREAPWVSIVVCSYNYARYLRDAIDSALAQTWRPLEVVVVDDGSTDESWSIVLSYGSRVLAVRRPNGGQGAAYNTGFAASRGHWILFLDADDRLDADAVQRMMARATPQVAKVQGALRMIDADNQRLGGVVPYLLHDGDVAPIARRFGQYASPPASGNLYRREAISPYLPMPEVPWRRCADTVPILLCVFHGLVHTVQGPVGDYRLHSQANSRIGVLGNSFSSLADALEQSRERVDKARDWGQRCTGLEWLADGLMVPWDWRVRALALRLEGAAAPFANDTRWSIWLGFNRSLAQWPGYRLLERSAQRAWMAFMLLVPRPLVSRLAGTNVSGIWRTRFLRWRRHMA
jgi:glycosyltransferase involved in cell wall biosynthesis